MLGSVQFKNFMATSNPRKHAALAGNALIITGDNPLNRALGPSVRIWKKNEYITHIHCTKLLTMSLKTAMMPEYIPGGEVCSLDFKVSGAIATTQFMTPAEPPASRIRAGLNSFRLYNNNNNSSKSLEILYNKNIRYSPFSLRNEAP